MTAAERQARAIQRMRDGKLSIGWYWVFGLMLLSALLLAVSVVIDMAGAK